MDKFLEELYKVDKVRIDDALDLLFDLVDDLCWVGNFEEVDSLLEKFNPELCSLSLSVGALSITFCAKDKLKNRDLLYALIFSRAEKVKGKEATEEMLRGLK